MLHSRGMNPFVTASLFRQPSRPATICDRSVWHHSSWLLYLKGSTNEITCFKMHFRMCWCLKLGMKRTFDYFHWQNDINAPYYISIKQNIIHLLIWVLYEVKTIMDLYELLGPIWWSGPQLSWHLTSYGVLSPRSRISSKNFYLVIWQSSFPPFLNNLETHLLFFLE